LTEKSVSVLYDDREEARAGEKFADADLMGIPYRVVISDKTLANNTFEIKARTSDAVEHLSRPELMQRFGI
jgi:prolyl-tRNA synthetase